MSSSKPLFVELIATIFDILLSTIRLIVIARFKRIEALVQRLSDKESATWRNKVIDVRNWFDFAAQEIDRDAQKLRSCYDGSSGQSGGEKAKLAFTILVAALAFQFDIDPHGHTPGRFHFVVVDEMFSKVDDQNAKYALKLFKQFGLQLLIVAPLDAKSKASRGRGYTVHRQQIRTRDFGNNPVPRAITIDTLDDLLLLTKREAEFKATSRVAEEVQAAFSKLSGWLKTNVRSLHLLADSVEGIIQVANYFISHPWPDCYARQIPVSVDTKFIHRHQVTLRQWLETSISTGL